MRSVSVALRPTPTTSNSGIFPHCKWNTRKIDCVIIRHMRIRAWLLLPWLSVPAFAAPVTFSEHIAPIVFNRCAGCHRPGEVGPFPLTSYQEVSKRAKLIAGVTGSRYMPPWHAEPSSVAFRDERRLSDAEIALIQEWAK